MDQINVLPGLITVTVLMFGALGIAWWSHSDNKPPKDRQ